MIGWLEKECADMMRIASFYRKRGKLAQAENTYRLIIDMREKSDDTDSLELGIAYYCLASVCADQNKFAAANPIYKKSIEIYQKNDRTKSDFALWYSDTLADLQELSGENDTGDAEALEKKA